jgi:hypothetical protein
LRRYTKAGLFLQEMLSIFAMPFLLWYGGAA